MSPGFFLITFTRSCLEIDIDKIKNCQDDTDYFFYFLFIFVTINIMMTYIDLKALKIAIDQSESHNQKYDSLIMKIQIK